MMTVLAVLIILGQLGLQLTFLRLVRTFGAYQDELKSARHDMKYTQETNILVYETAMRLLTAIREQQTNQRLNRESA